MPSLESAAYLHASSRGVHYVPKAASQQDPTTHSHSCNSSTTTGLQTRYATRELPHLSTRRHRSSCNPFTQACIQALRTPTGCLIMSMPMEHKRSVAKQTQRTSQRCAGPPAELNFPVTLLARPCIHTAVLELSLIEANPPS
jgi:hypothetical protein